MRHPQPASQHLEHDDEQQQGVGHSQHAEHQLGRVGHERIHLLPWLGHEHSQTWKGRFGHMLATDLLDD
ncbi:hypothetical protein NOK12_24820 [Nocardioides sp. OK12]|nr:hypothetical protein NOK12_24820 [Nocardioides sp. OK12]